MAETRHALYTREFLEQARAFTYAPGMAGDAAAADDYRAHRRRHDSGRALLLCTVLAVWSDSVRGS
jgi:hypothetical protein